MSSLPVGISTSCMHNSVNWNNSFQVEVRGYFRDLDATKETVRSISEKIFGECERITVSSQGQWFCVQAYSTTFNRVSSKDEFEGASRRMGLLETFIRSTPKGPGESDGDRLKNLAAKIVS